MEFLKSTFDKTFKPLRDCSNEEADQEEKKQQFQIKRIANGHQVMKFYARFATLEKTYGINLFIQVFLSLLYYQLEYQSESTKASLILKILTTHAILSLLLGSLAHFSLNDWKNAQIKGEQTQSLVQLVLDWVIILVQPYTFLQSYNIQNWNYRDQVNVPFKLNFLLSILSMLKFYLILPCVMNLLKFKNPRSSRVCKIYGCENSNLFQIKCYFKSSAIILVANIIAFLLMFFTFAYRVSERNQKISPNLFQYYGNCVWIVIVTMTTVGFGDFTPVTFLGRTFGLLCTFCGAMVVSLMVLVVINTFQMDNNEDQSLKILKSLSHKKQIKKLAGQYIRLSLWRLWRNKKLTKNGLCQLVEQQSRQQKSKRHSFRQLIKNSKYINEISQKNLPVEMNRQFERISFNIENINNNFDSIMNYLSNQYFLNIDEIKDKDKDKDKGESKTHDLSVQ